MEKKPQDIHERIYTYIIQVLRIVKRVKRSFENDVIIGQLLRSITSVGANDQEANGSFTKADFIHCYTIARKEMRESLFWIRLLGDTNDALIKEIHALIPEGNEISKIITAIILNTKKGI